MMTGARTSEAVLGALGALATLRAEETIKVFILAGDEHVLENGESEAQALEMLSYLKIGEAMAGAMLELWDEWPCRP